MSVQRKLTLAESLDSAINDEAAKRGLSAQHVIIEALVLRYGLRVPMPVRGRHTARAAEMEHIGTIKMSRKKSC